MNINQTICLKKLHYSFLYIENYGNKIGGVIILINGPICGFFLNKHPLRKCIYTSLNKINPHN